MTRRLLVLSALASILVFAFIGCGKTVIDMEKAQTGIATGIEKETGLKIKSVECPEDIEAKKGKTFTCTATDDQGRPAKVKVDQTDNKGNIQWSLAEGAFVR